MYATSDSRRRGAGEERMSACLLSARSVFSARQHGPYQLSAHFHVPWPTTSPNQYLSAIFVFLLQLIVIGRRRKNPRRGGPGLVDGLPWPFVGQTGRSGEPTRWAGRVYSLHVAAPRPASSMPVDFSCERIPKCFLRRRFTKWPPTKVGPSTTRSIFWPAPCLNMARDRKLVGNTIKQLTTATLQEG